jgi:hypothetical protein
MVWGEGWWEDWEEVEGEGLMRRRDAKPEAAVQVGMGGKRARLLPTETVEVGCYLTYLGRPYSPQGGQKEGREGRGC